MIEKRLPGRPLSFISFVITRKHYLTGDRFLLGISGRKSEEFLPDCQCVEQAEMTEDGVTIREGKSQTC